MTPVQRLKLSLFDAFIPGEPSIPIPIRLAATGGLDGTALEVAARLIPGEPVLPSASSFDLFFELEAHPDAATAPVLIPPNPVIPSEPTHLFGVVFDATVEGLGLVRQTARFEITAGQPLLFTNILVGAPQSPAFHVTFDLLQTSGELLTSEDLFTVTISAVAALAGDYNLDGTVDSADYVVWRKGLGTTYTQDHFNIWRAHFGQTAGGGASLPSTDMLSPAVPEPISLVVLLMGVLLILAQRCVVVL